MQVFVVLLLFMAIEVERVLVGSFSICAFLMAGFVLCFAISRLMFISLEMLLSLTFPKKCVHVEYQSIGLVRLRVFVLH